MKKFYLQFLLCVLSAMAALPAGAQVFGQAGPAPGVYVSRPHGASAANAPAAPRPVFVADDNTTTLYGIMLWSYGWQSLDAWSYPYGVYSFTDTSFSPELQYPVAPNAITGVMIDGYYYVVTRETDSSQVLKNISIIKYNCESGEAESTVDIAAPRYSKLPLILTRDESAGLTYALTYTDDNKSHVLATIDLASGAMNTVGIIGEVSELPSFLTLSATGDGKIYAIATDGKLYTIDVATVAVAEVGSTGVTPQYLQSAVYDPAAACLWWAASLADSSAALYKVSTETGSATKIGSFTNSEEFVGLCMMPGQTDAQAPAACSGVAFVPSADGATTGKLTGTLPSTTAGGTAISGELSVSVAVDGTVVKTFTGAPGSDFAVELSLETGMRNFTVVASTPTAEGIARNLSVWVGRDVPAAVQNLILVNVNGMADLSWTASAGGQHGGYCPVADIRYRVTRRDGTVAADALTQTSFTENFPEVIGQYSYTVTPYVEGGEAGIAIESNTVQAGDFFGLPVSFNFNLDTEFENYFVPIDNNDDGNTWQFSYTWDDKVGVALYPTSWMNAADDYLVFPGLRFEKGIVYSLSFDNSTGYSGCTESVDILIGNFPSVNSLTTKIAGYDNILDMPEPHQEVRFTVGEDGVYYIAFYIHSPASQSYFYIDDVKIEALGNAAAPASVEFTAVAASEQGNDSVTLTLKAPATTLSGEALTSITAIDVYRGDDTEAAHTFTSPAAGSDLEWTDTTPGSGPVNYRVVARNEAGLGEWSAAEVFVGGIVPPVEYTFDSEDVLEYFTIVNANHDDSTWQFEKGYNSVSMVYNYNLFEDADDWLFSPNLRLSADRVYKVEATLSTNQFPENLAITIGAGTDPAAHSVLLDMPGLCSEQRITRSQWIKVTDNGDYNIGFHAYSPKNLLRIYLYGFKVTDVASAKAPDMPTDLTVSAAPQGALSATLAFKAPELACNGDNLSSLSAVEVYRGTETTPAYTFTDVAPGQALTWTDTQVFQGLNTYSVLAVNAEGSGISAVASAYVGIDMPAAPVSLKAKGDATNANTILSWEAPSTGVNGGYVVPEDLTYNIYYGESVWGLSPIATGVEATEFEHNLDFTGLQSARTYVVESCSEAGIGARDTVTVAIGALHPYPMAETFENYLSGEWVNTILTNYNASWMVSQEQDGVTSVDEGSGFLQFQKWASDDKVALGILEAPKVQMAGASNPWISLSFYHNPLADERKQMTVGYRVDDGEFIELATLAANGADEGWTEYSWPIDADGASYVSVVLHAQTYDNATRMFVDNITLDDRLAHNLALTAFTGPSEIGHEGAQLMARVQNKGTEAADGFDVVLTCNGQDVATKTGTALAAGASSDFEFDIAAPAATEAGTERIYQVRIDYAPDMKEADNTSGELACAMLTSPFPGITTLVAENADGSVALAWEEPVAQWCPSVTESFEDYTPYAIDQLGEWVLYDGDGQRTIGIRYGLTFTDWYTPKAWQVWDPWRADLLGDDVAPRSGYLCLMSMKSDGTVPDQAETVDAVNDDWLISEEVEAGSDITFWLKQPVDYYGGNEAVEILYSAGSQDPADFELLRTIELEGMAQWNGYRVSLPEDARYFAIRHHQSFFGIWLDDVTYSPLRTATPLTIESYNIYRDGELIGTADTNAYLDRTATVGTHIYAVAPLFDQGEGRLSNQVEVVTTPTGIDAAEAGVIIGSRHGEITITTTATLPVEVYTPAGLMIVRTVADSYLSIPVQSGIYLVKAGATVQKTVVP